MAMRKSSTTNLIDRNDVLYRNLEIAKSRISASPLAQGFRTGVPAVLMYRNSTSSPVLIWMKTAHVAGLASLFEYGYNSGVGINGMASLHAGTDGYSESTFQILLPGEEMWGLTVNCNVHWRVISLNNLL